MIAKLLALFQNRPATRKEELIVEALRRETRLEYHGDRHPNDAEEGVQEIMRSIIASQAKPSSMKSPATILSMPTFGALATMAMALLVFMSLSKKEKSVSPSLADQVETQTTETYPIIRPAEALPEESLNTLSEIVYTFPLLEETTRLKRDINRGTDSLLAIVLPWGDLVNLTPTLTIPVFPPLPQTPYQTELDNLRQDTKQAIDFIGGAFSIFNG